MRRFVGGGALAWVLMLCLASFVRAETKGDIEDGKDIYAVCAPCHGNEGQGGGGGEYPRLAGFPEKYLIDQLRAFKVQDRANFPMLPFTAERELSDQDVLDVSAYIATMTLETRLPDLDKAMDGYRRLLAAKRVLQIPRAPGDLRKGGALYRTACARCHGEKAEGRAPHDPPLAGQHTRYLKKQFTDILKDRRLHPRPRKLIAPLSDEDITDLLAYFSVLDDG